MLEIIKPLNNCAVPLLTDIQKKFIEDEYGRSQVDGSFTFKWDALVQTGTDRSMPAPVCFSWKSDVNIASAEISTNKSFSDKRSYEVSCDTLYVYNLCPDTVYYWHLIDVDGTASETFTFITEDMLPRFIKVDGITNVRDAGGWDTENSGKMRVGLLYRGSELNSHVSITENGVLAMREDMHIKTDFDLRGEAIGVFDSSPVQTFGANWKLLPASAYHNVFAEENREKLKMIFSELAEYENYPVYIHCWGGADRAGTIILLVQAIVGVPLKTLFLDYELTSLSIWGIRTRNYSEFMQLIEYIEKFGNTDEAFSIKTERALIAAGVEKKNIDSIKMILTI